MYDIELLPGDRVRVTGEFTVDGYDGFTIETVEGPELDCSDIDYEVVSVRPANWPPEEHDVWRVGHEHLHALAGEFLDGDGTSYDLSDWLSTNGFDSGDLKLAFRPGIVDASLK